MEDKINLLIETIKEQNLQIDFQNRQLDMMQKQINSIKYAVEI
jgi:hypothetical protein|tara:strand:- start:3160 stop:3288 length:129 start_codon:yes stop_codon:yes gene_type:complete